MDSYIRSKYESRRWAREGPAPEDPAILESDAPAPVAAPSQPAPVPAQPAAPTHVSRASVSARPQQGQSHQLLSAGVAASRQTPQPQQQQPAPVQPQAPVQQPPQSAALDLFSLDFHAPASPPPQQQAQPKKDVTSEIMSLFATAAPAAPAAAPPAYSAGVFGAQPAQAQGQFGQSGGMGAQPQAGWGQQPQQQAVPQQTSMVGNAGVGMWGASSGWNSAPAAPPAGPDIWGSGGLGGGVPAQQQSSLFSTSDVWSTPAATPAPATTQKKDDVFGDLWGGFK
ncbi:hypothetical protein TRAPUB_10586 [Trametes pubescens]|uniref:Arf-GAP domain-containing protein n=1 Tax=Trametes pubescens TaxID=154538 RepID=A0A1M2VZ45_TRAPU|nr:hypothetical protein TRAPUB_10586 [Trametes pubescens]